MMQIGSFLIIEFSKKPNACYVYQADQLPFEPYSKFYDGGTRDLAAGFREASAARIVHREGWQARAGAELRALGIGPDQADTQRATTGGFTGGRATTATRQDEATPRVQSETYGPDMVAVQVLVTKFRGARIDDKRVSSNGGRLWVEDPLQRVQLASELKALGFRWSDGRQAWYYPGN
jgi:hypothetical protein